MPIKTYTMRDPESSDVSLSPLDKWVADLEEGTGRMDPYNPKHQADIKMMMEAISSGQLSVESVEKLARNNPKTAHLLTMAYGEWKAKSDTRMKLGQFFKNATPDKEVPEMYQPYGPTQEGPAMQEVATGKTQTIPGEKAINDVEGAITYLNRLGMFDQAKKLHDMYKGGSEGALYGGVQYAYNPTTGKYVPYTIDKNTRQAVPITPPEGTEATVPMMPQQIALPGGQTTVVQIPSRGVPPAGGVKPSGLTPAHPLSMDAAGKIAMLNQASEDIDQAMGLMFKDGKFDKGLVAKMNVPLTAGLGGDARIAYSAIHNAVAAKLRAETGAAANRDEVDDIARRFMPTVLDTDESARNKMTRLKQFMNEAVDVVDPNKLYKKPDRTPANSPGSSAAPKITPEQARQELIRRKVIRQ